MSFQNPDKVSSLVTSVVDPHWFQWGSGSSIFVNANPDTDPDPHPGLMTKNWKKFFLIEFSSLWCVILALLDPDPDPYFQCGSGSSRPK